MDDNKLEDYEKEHAALAMIRAVNENPHQVSILCLGPLT
jgi:inosine-uridine nucleoside N-ribohydrolase